MGISSGGGGGSSDAALGPASSTDNAIAVYDGTTGKVLRDSGVTVNPSTNSVTLPTDAALITRSTGGDAILHGAGTSGPRWKDTDENNRWLSFVISALSVDRAVTWPDAAGTVTLGGNTFTGSGDVVRATSPTFATSIVLPGGLIFIGFTSAAGAASTTELTTDKMVSIHKHTGTSAIHLAYNDGGVIKSVQLT